MLNIVTQGSQVIEKDDSVESTINVPVNEDKGFLGKVVAYNKPKLTLEKVWDKATTKEQFFAIAKFLNKAGEPENGDIEVGSFLDVHRVGVGNNNFTGTPANFQLGDATNLTDPSFVCFFPEAGTLVLPPIPPLGVFSGTSIVVDFGPGIGVKTLFSRYVLAVSVVFTSWFQHAHFSVQAFLGIIRIFFDSSVSNNWWAFHNNTNTYWKGPSTISHVGTYTRVFGTGGTPTINVPVAGIPPHVDVLQSDGTKYILVLFDTSRHYRQTASPPVSRHNLTHDNFPITTATYSIFGGGQYQAEKPYTGGSYNGVYTATKAVGQYNGITSSTLTEVN